MCGASRPASNTPDRVARRSSWSRFRRVRGSSDAGNRAFALPDARLDLVHAGHLWDLPQSEERDRDPDVDRTDAPRGEHQFRGVLSVPQRPRRSSIRDVRAHCCGGRGRNRSCDPGGLFPQPRDHRGRRHQSDEGLTVSVAAVFLPLLGAVVAGFFGRWIGDRGAQLATCLAMLVSAAAGVALFIEVALNGSEFVTPLFSFIDAGKLQVDWALKFDTLSAVMVAMVTVVSAMIHIYSVGYMAEDPSIPRFMSYLSLFTFFMLALVTSENFVQLFFGWEGVGLVSYLLIGFWYDRPSANAAAIKAFVVNRIGDFGFALGIFAVFSIFGTLHFDEVFRAAPNQVGTTVNFLGWQVP